MPRAAHSRVLLSLPNAGLERVLRKGELASPSVQSEDATNNNIDLFLMVAT